MTMIAVYLAGSVPSFRRPHSTIVRFMVSRYGTSFARHFWIRQRCAAMNRFEHFREVRKDLAALLGGVVDALASPLLLQQDCAQQREKLACLIARNPFLDLCYLLDAEGRQIGDNVAASRRRDARDGDGVDRSHRPYYRLAQEAVTPVLTEPYLSSANGHICVTAAAPIRDENGQLLGILVADSELDRALSLLEEDDIRRGFEPYFKIFYSLFSAGLLTVSAALGFHAIIALGPIWSAVDSLSEFTAPFQATILFTLALAVFDLAKTIFEEEVLLRKDIRRHSTTRRTLTRFIAAILIAVSIEGLMLVFKFALDAPQQLWLAELLLLAAAALLVALGLYVYLGAQAEVLLSRHRDQRHDSS